MSFGFGLSDFIAVGAFAFKVYTLCKEAPENFRDISAEVHSLHAVLKEAERRIFAQPLSQESGEGLTVIAEGCRRVLKDLDSLVKKYERMSGTQRKRPWLRLKWGSENVAELRARLTANTVLLSAWIISVSRPIVENKFDHLSSTIKPPQPTPQISGLSRSESKHSKSDSSWDTQTSDSIPYTSRIRSTRTVSSRPRQSKKVNGILTLPTL